MVRQIVLPPLQVKTAAQISGPARSVILSMEERVREQVRLMRKPPRTNYKPESKKLSAQPITCSESIVAESSKQAWSALACNIELSSVEDETALHDNTGKHVTRDVHVDAWEKPWERNVSPDLKINHPEFSLSSKNRDVHPGSLIDARDYIRGVMARHNTRDHTQTESDIEIAGEKLFPPSSKSLFVPLSASDPALALARRERLALRVKLHSNSENQKSSTDIAASPISWLSDPLLDHLPSSFYMNSLMIATKPNHARASCVTPTTGVINSRAAAFAAAIKPNLVPSTIVSGILLDRLQIAFSNDSIESARPVPQSAGTMSIVNRCTECDNLANPASKEQPTKANSRNQFEIPVKIPRLNLTKIGTN